MGNKACRTCKETKNVELFHKDKTKRDGRSNQCKLCNKARLKERYYANREECNAKARQWHQDNKERRSAYDREKYRKNKAKVDQRAKVWREANTEKVAAYKVNWRLKNLEHYNTRKRINEGARRARRNALTFSIFTSEQLDARIAFYGGKCWICRTADYTELDHVKPLARGGAHILANLRPACSKCNRAKSSQWPVALDSTA